MSFQPLITEYRGPRSAVAGVAFRDYISRDRKRNAERRSLIFYLNALLLEENKIHELAQGDLRRIFLAFFIDKEKRLLAFSLSLAPSNGARRLGKISQGDRNAHISWTSLLPTLIELGYPFGTNLEVTKNVETGLYVILKTEVTI